MGFGVLEVLIILLIAVLLFRARKLPELARGLGRAKREFEEAQRSDDP
ncbi:twin-arginine translocase TatA/TatE family subunit [Calidithermus roseus]|uniref:Sec-independent protein translocase protein TatA n=1 Tax=Calidithermus roseus TaxID=1644118 RepID=A0A399F027_9DEIN|nr:twin-arginine translocase TatA/TatE family subunit [Calidithermus roseus]RIH89006.1 Sec-independent protein translocase protein TatA [Calidithermus roseus]